MQSMPCTTTIHILKMRAIETESNHCLMIRIIITENYPRSTLSFQMRLINKKFCFRIRIFDEFMQSNESNYYYMSKWINTSPTSTVSILQNWKTKISGNFIQLSKRTSPKYTELDLEFCIESRFDAIQR